MALDNGSDLPAEFYELKRKYGIPPLPDKVVAGSMTWKSVREIDHSFTGYFLACHLAIEHYMDHVLQQTTTYLQWEAARLNFGQKAALLGQFADEPLPQLMPAIKHMNAIRNKLSHNLNYVIDDDALLPLKHLIEAGRSEPGKEVKAPDDAFLVLQKFTSLCCFFWAGAIAAGTEINKLKKTRSSSGT